VADGQRQLGAVERVEVEFLHPSGAQQPALLGGDSGREQSAQLGIGVRPVEEAGQPVRHLGATDAREAFQLGVVGDGQNAGDDRHRNPGAARTVHKPQIRVHLEKNWVMAREAPASILRLRLSR
jgi:hypothetical protein